MPATPLRNVRIEDDIWYPAMRRAEAEGRALSEVVREILREYGRGQLTSALAECRPPRRV
jgi:hypothetical protein